MSAGVTCFRCSCFANPRSARSLLARGVGFGKALLPGFALPVVVAYSSPVNDKPAAKLPKHGTRSHDGDLTGSIRVRKNFLVDQVVLFRLGRDYFVKRLVLVEQKIRVSIIQDTCTLGGKHKQFVSSVRHEEGPAPILSAVERVSCLSDLLFSSLVLFAGKVLVSLGIQLVGGMVPDGR